MAILRPQLRSQKLYFWILALVAVLLGIRFAPARAQETGPQLALLDRDGAPVSEITDGDEVRLRANLPGQSESAVTFSFNLDGSIPLGSCRVEAAQSQCETAPFRAWGWYWDGAGQPAPLRRIGAVSEGSGQSASLEVGIAPRPVVMVHGLVSSWEAWTNYLGQDGYLASAGIPAFAVGDGQFPGLMNTGSIIDPGARTNTIAENAAILGAYIAQVKQATGAQSVDLLGHSMGGLISRYYIGRVMEARDVGRLIMLGSPMAGTDCANLPAALQLYLPATLEIQPGYVLGIFNPQVSARQGVPFHGLAGVSIIDPIASPCTATPTDIAVSLESVSAIPLHFSELPLLHTDLNLSQEVFSTFLLPILQTPAGEFVDEPDPLDPATSPTPLQFTRVYTGHVDAGGSQDLTIQIEPGLTLANFALYDTTRSLAVTVTGASGNVIALDAATTGLTVLDDPAALFYLGYGFENPSPGPWQIRLEATAGTPAGGADYAIRARLAGGAALHVSASSLLPQVGEAVLLSARLELAGAAIPLEQGTVAVQPVEGAGETLEMVTTDGIGAASWAPTAPGLYSIAVSAAGRLPDGSAFERTAHLVVEAQPQTTPARAYATIAGIILLLCLAGGLFAAAMVVLLQVMRKKRAGQSR